MSISAYNVGKNFGVRTNVGYRTQTNNDVYGTRSPIFYVHTMLGSKAGCQGTE